MTINWNEHWRGALLISHNNLFLIKINGFYKTPIFWEEEVSCSIHGSLSSINFPQKFYGQNLGRFSGNGIYIEGLRKAGGKFSVILQEHTQCCHLFCSSCYRCINSAYYSFIQYPLCSPKLLTVTEASVLNIRGLIKHSGTFFWANSHMSLCSY